MDEHVLISVVGAQQIEDMRERMATLLCERGEFKLASRREALEKGLCVVCAEPALDKCTTNRSRKDYQITAICEVCYGRMFPEEE